MDTVNGSMKGRVCLITGATNGIGRITARELAKRGATLVLVGRSPDKVNETVQALRNETGNEAVEGMVADLGSLEAIRGLAQAFKAKYPRLHVLINNAGAINGTRTLTRDGFETTFGVNHLAYFLLTHLLLDRLKESAPARIVNVASDGHRIGQIDFDDLQSQKKYDPLKVYCTSKLANVLFTYELARRLEGTGVTANTLHPGAVATGFAADNQTWFGFLVKIGRPFLMGPEKGAETSIYLAASPEVEGVTGKYFKKKKAVKSSKESYDTAVARRLWEVSEKLTGIAG